jgi:glycerophosphoryl diester phosphodiesterase
VKKAQSLGLKVIPWTINNPANMERLVAWGVEGSSRTIPTGCGR